MMKSKILVIEDDPRIKELVSSLLEKEGHQVHSARSLWQAEGETTRFVPDLIVLDRQLPDGDGLEFCRRLKAEDKTKSIPILFLTSKKTLTDKVVGLKMGGDDYLTKPFEGAELAARVDVLLRRGTEDGDPLTVPLKTHEIHLDRVKHICHVKGKPVELWPKEYELLQVFMEKPGRLLAKEFLSERVWGHDFLPNSRAVDMAVQRLRRKLGKEGKHLQTVKGYGYRLNEE